MAEGPGRMQHFRQVILNMTKKRPLNDRQKQQVKRLIGGRQELKYFGTVINGQNMVSTGTIASITDIPQNDTDSGRDGDRVKLVKKMELYIAINSIPANTNPGNRCRVIIFQWKEQTTPTMAKILLTGVSGGIDVSSRYSHDNRMLYRIILDRTFTLIGTGSTATSNILTSKAQATYQSHNYWRRMKNIATQVQFEAAGTTGNNKLWVAYLSDQASNYPVLYMGTKLFFTDS